MSKIFSACVARKKPYELGVSMDTFQIIFVLHSFGKYGLISLIIEATWQIMKVNHLSLHTVK